MSPCGVLMTPARPSGASFDPKAPPEVSFAVSVKEKSRWVGVELMGPFKQTPAVFDEVDTPVDTPGK